MLKITKRHRDEIETQHQELTAKLSISLRKIARGCLRARNIESDYGTDASYREIAHYAAKDWQRVALYHDDNTDPIKLAGYVGFWVRKLKPLSQAVRADRSSIPDINERLALWVSASFVEEFMHGGNIEGNPRKFAKKLESLENDERTLNYIIHSMRVRTFGPHHFVILLMMINRS